MNADESSLDYNGLSYPYRQVMSNSIQPHCRMLGTDYTVKKSSMYVTRSPTHESAFIRRSTSLPPWGLNSSLTSLSILINIQNIKCGYIGYMYARRTGKNKSIHLKTWSHFCLLHDSTLAAMNNKRYWYQWYRLWFGFVYIMDLFCQFSPYSCLYCHPKILLICKCWHYFCVFPNSTFPHSCY